VKVQTLAFLALAAAALALPLRASADDMSALLAKHKAYVGFTFGDGSLKSLDVTEETSRDKDHSVARSLRWNRLGAVYRVDTRDIKANSGWSTGFTGNLFWYSDENGFTVPVIGDAAKSALSSDLLFTDAVAALPWLDRGTGRVGATTCRIVRVTQPNALAIDLYVDPATGAYKRAVIDPGGEYEATIDILGYADAEPGKKIISKWHCSDDDITHNDTQIVADAPVSDADLHPPAPSATWEFANPAPFPINLTPDRIVVKAKVNGVLGTFMLDTGAQNIFLSGAFARRAGLKALGHTQLSSLVGTEQNDTGKAATIDFAGNVLRDVTLYFGSGEFDDKAPDGLLGFDVFAGAFVTIDFVNSTLQIQDPGGIDVAATAGVHAAVDLGDGTPIVPMSVQKTVEVHAILDTGSPHEVLIPADLPERFGLHLSGGTVCGRLDNITLGPIVYDEPTACALLTTGTREALVGYDFLKGLAKIHFDYQHAQLIFVPRKP
jgi:hypothetical protein